MIKRTLFVISAAFLAASSFAQGSFTIRRPLSGATVREVIPIRVPLDSIPQTGFVGIWINGTFIEAVAPVVGKNIQGNEFVYKLDSKARKLRDGKLNIELVLYADAGRSNRVLNKTSVSLNLDNFSSIRIPASGLKLRYSLIPNMEYTYALEMSQTISLASDADLALNRENALQSQSEKFRYKYAVVSKDNSKDGPVGTILLQPLVNKGKDYAWITTSGATESKKYYDYMMHPIYMRIDSMGREKWGGAPFYTPLEGSAGEISRMDLYGVFPLPILPSRGLKVGGPPFAGTIQTGQSDLEKLREQKRFTTTTSAQGVFEGVEWERGLRCAKIRNSISQGSKATGLQEYQERFWFAIDLGMVIKLERTTTRIIEQRDAPTGGGAGGAGGGGGAARPSRGAAAGGSGGGTNTSQGAEWIQPEFVNEDMVAILDPGMTIFQSGRRGGGGVGGGRGTGSGGGVAAGNNPTSGGSRGRTRNLRIRSTYTLTME